MKKFFVCAAMLLSVAFFASCNKDHDPKFPYDQYVLTFDGLEPAMYASDVYGDNLYGKGYYWLDPVTGLGSKPVDDQYYSGGTAISKFGPVELLKEDYMDWYKSQLAVAYKNSGGFPGFSETEHCLVSFGWADPNGWNHAPTINFTDTDTTTRIIDGLYICNTSYALAQMQTDLGSGVPMSKENLGYFKVKFIGLDANGNQTGVVEAYLANFTSSPGYFLEKWQPVTLTGLGRIHALKIDMESSDTGAYGMNTPAYVAIDCIIVRVDRGTTVKANKANIL